MGDVGGFVDVNVPVLAFFDVFVWVEVFPTELKLRRLEDADGMRGPSV